MLFKYTSSRLVCFLLNRLNIANRSLSVFKLQLVDIRRQGTEGSLAEQQVDLFERQPLGFLEREPNRRQRDDKVEGHENEVEFPANGAEADGGDLSPESAPEPVANTSCCNLLACTSMKAAMILTESAASSTNLHGHNSKRCVSL